jgi:hypothetical protein
MRPLLPFIVLLMLLLCSFTAAQDTPSTVSDSVRTERLAGLCELWGVVKYFHPYLAYKDIDWDEALIQTIPRINEAETPEDYKRAIEYLLSFLQDPNTYVQDDSYVFPRSKISDLLDKEWYPSIIWAEDSIAVIIASNFDVVLEAERSYFPSKWYQRIIKKSRGVIIDARCLIGSVIRKYDGSSASRRLLKEFTYFLLDIVEDTVLAEPSVRSRVHSPFMTPESPWHWHESGFIYHSGDKWFSREEDFINRVPVVFIINEGSADLLPMLGALQDKKRGAIIFEGQFDREGGIKTYKVQLPDDVNVEVRLTEIVRSDGTEGVHPDLVIPFTTDTTLLDCPPVRTAIDIINGHREVPPVVGNLLSPVVPRFYEKTYGDMPAPKLEYRLLALFRFWNEIKYFSPHLDRVGDSWESVLRELIPVFEAANGEKAYESAIELMTGKSGDFSAYYYGNSCFPSFNVDFIEDKTVVTFTGRVDSSSSIAGLSVGDIVLELDGEDIFDSRKRLAGLISEPRRINYELLGARHPSPIGIKVQKADGRIEQYEISRRYGRPTPSIRNYYLTPFEKIGDDIPYMWMGSLSKSIIEDSLDVIMSSRALILDLRQHFYQHSIDWRGRLVSILAEHEAIACLKRGVERNSPDPDIYSWGYVREKVVPDDEFHYRGKVVALIDASTHGETEKLCLYLDAATEVTFMGMPTNGRPGEYSPILLPGFGKFGPQVDYVNIDVRYPDDRPVYGIGIQPDIYVEPTIEGIRQGKDEILDAAIDFLTGNSKK